MTGRASRTPGRDRWRNSAGGRLPPCRNSLRSLLRRGAVEQEAEVLEDEAGEAGGAVVVDVPTLLWPVPRGARWARPSTAREPQGPRPHGCAMPGDVRAPCGRGMSRTSVHCRGKEPKWRGSHRLPLAPEVLQPWYWLGSRCFGLEAPGCDLLWPLLLFFFRGKRPAGCRGSRAQRERPEPKGLQGAPKAD